MTHNLLTQLENLISNLQDDKADYYAENNNRTDEHIMWLVGQIDGIKSAINLIKGA